MSQASNVLVVIPSRRASTRLPEKPLADICGKPMVVHVWERAKAANIGDVVVATDCQEIIDVVKKAGGDAVMTSTEHQSGSDRIHEAVNLHDPEGRYGVVVNLQGDLPCIEPEVLRRVMLPLERDAGVDIATVITKMQDTNDRVKPNHVKAAMEMSPTDETVGRALYFSRSAVPYSADENAGYFRHLGLYAYRRSALEHFVSLSPSVIEKRESLEQLRALAAGMRIDAAVVETKSVEVDTPEDLIEAREVISAA